MPAVNFELTNSIHDPRRLIREYLNGYFYGLRCRKKRHHPSRTQLLSKSFAWNTGYNEAKYHNDSQWMYYRDKNNRAYIHTKSGKVIWLPDEERNI